MKQCILGTLSMLVLLAAPALAAPPINGEADLMYGSTPLVTQDTSTGYGDANLGRPDIANGSELDSAYAIIQGGTLYLVLAGNLETNGNRLDIFFDTRAGGQNQLLGTNPDIDFNGLNRLGFLDPNYPGLKFDAGFEADYFVTVNAFGLPTAVYASYAELYVDSGNPGVAYYLGDGQTRCETTGGAMANGDPNCPFLASFLCSVDNSNTLGVLGGYGLDSGAGVKTGVEIAIPLSAIGSPAGAFKICAFITDGGHDSLSNQVLGGIFGSVGANLGEPRVLDFGTVFGNQYFTVTPPTPTYGACCVSGSCSITTQAGCAGTWYENVSCDGNPCDATPQGACCIGGVCSIRTAGDCAASSGDYQGDGTNCDGCPCPQYGACCTGESCAVVLENDCTGTFLGAYTDCGTLPEENPCLLGACCTEGVCTQVRHDECTAGGGRWVGAGTPCDVNTCTYTIPSPHVAGGMNGWDAAINPMTSTGPGVWQLTFNGLTPSTRYEFKITNGSWSLSLPTTGNSWCFTDATGTVLITYDGNFYADGWFPERDRLPLPSYSDPGTWTAVGDWQDGTTGYDAGADWLNNDPNTVMAAQGGGIYKYSRTGLEIGAYEWKAVISGSWDALGYDNRTVNAANQVFTTIATADTVDFYVDALTGRIKVVVVTAPQHPCQLNGDMSGNAVVDNFDINLFVYALSHTPAQFAAQYPAGNYWCADGDCNNTVDNFDINKFVKCLTHDVSCVNCP